MTDIDFTKKQHIGCITLQRNTALNALTLSMILKITEKLYKWQDDQDIHAVIITSASNRAFCAGGDVRAMHTAKNDRAAQIDFFKHEYHLNHLIACFKKPYIAMMDGLTMGGGVGISMHGSFPVASERFVFAMPETGIGFFPDIGASYILSRLPDAYGMYLGLTGSQIGYTEAYATNLIKYCIAADQIPATINKLIAADLSQNAHHRVKEILQAYAIAIPAVENNQRFSYIKQCFQQPSIEAIMTILASTQNPWHQDTLKLLQQKSPLSLKVTFLQLTRAKTLSLKECLAMDLNLTTNFMQAHDFYEGVRALLIDKDKTPRWQPNTLEQVSDASAAHYFI